METQYIFTIHFATINTKKDKIAEIIKKLFTIHFATINTKINNFRRKNIINLQYTLLLLILN